jgi:hypothetical protein
MRRSIALYGRLKDAGLGAAVEIELPSGATAREALAVLRAALGGRAELLSGCALATENAVLGPSAKVPLRGALAALPPVCGG